MSYDADMKAREFGDKWLPAFQSAFLEGWADRFYNEITAALLEAHTAGIKAAADGGMGLPPPDPMRAEIGTPTESKVRWNYGEIAQRLVPIQKMPDPLTTPKYVCPMKRPSGEPKNCGECKRNRRDKPGACYCCGAALVPTTT